MQATVEYRTDGGNWSSPVLLTHTTSTLNSDGLGDLVGFELPANGQLTKGREFEFRIKSNYGAVVSGLAYSYDDKIKSPLFL